MNFVLAAIFVIVALYLGILISMAPKAPVAASPALRNEDKMANRHRWFFVALFTSLAIFFALSGVLPVLFSPAGVLALAVLIAGLFLAFYQKVRSGTIAVVAALVLVFGPVATNEFNGYNLPAPEAQLEFALPQGPTDQDEGAANVSGEEAQAAAVGTGTAPADCVAQNWYPIVNGRIIPTGTHQEGVETTAASSDAVLRQAISQDARTLFDTAKFENVIGNVSDVSSLVTPDKACLSEAGLALRDAVIAKWDSASIELVSHVEGFNTGRGADGSLVYGGTLTGDTQALVRSYPDGSSTTTLTRCGNFVIPITNPPKPHEPVNPPETTPPTVPPTTPPTTPPPTSPPPTTPPPTTPPPTTPPPTTPPPTPEPTKDPSDDVIDGGGFTPAPSPSGEPETEEPVENNPAPPPSDEGGTPGDEVINVPAPDVEPGTGEEPRDEETIPDVPEDVPANEDDAPLEGDFDPDAASIGTSSTIGGLIITALLLLFLAPSVLGFAKTRRRKMRS